MASTCLGILLAAAQPSFACICNSGWNALLKAVHVNVHSCVPDVQRHCKCCFRCAYCNNTCPCEDGPTPSVSYGTFLHHAPGDPNLPIEYPVGPLRTCRRAHPCNAKIVCVQDVAGHDASQAACLSRACSCICHDLACAFDRTQVLQLSPLPATPLAKQIEGMLHA